ncbi:unnamed protein product [Polarella glacialis]|uniref:VTT domain-containing protein n=1 Tax=Polarella glacialis TaxID=89957 RepID=A0A813HJL8_POLGL|nr:unnamed protein product [Polarella glacialis]
MALPRRCGTRGACGASRSRLGVCSVAAVLVGVCLGCSHSFSTLPPAVPSQRSANSEQGSRTILTRGFEAFPAGQSGRKLQQRRALPEALSALQDILDSAPAYVETLGPLGPLYFFGIYVFAECLALPATPLTLSCGFIFGVPLGCLVALSAASTAAAIAFFLSRTVLRPQIIKIAEENDDFQKVNLAVEGEGFKIILLLRLAPLLPFGLSNYLFGLTSVGFTDFIGATALGITPTTCGFVYLATVARTAISSEGAGQPWYVYAGGAALTVFLLAQVKDIAQKAVEEAVQAKAAKQVAGP